MDTALCTALIRTCNSAKTLPRTLASLRCQTRAPSAYVIVDSGSTDATLGCLPDNALVHRYAGKAFNYSAALNQGLDHVRTDFVLIISSHTSLANPGALSYALELLAASEDIGAAYFCGAPGALGYERIDTRNFDGFNGLWNTCALIKMPLLKKRRFRPEVFSAEDQEWANWLLHCEGKTIARISGAGLQNDNPQRYSRKKKLDEHAAIALFSNRRLLDWPYLTGLACKVVRLAPRPTLRERYFSLLLLVRLLSYRFTKPTIPAKERSNA